MWARGRLLPTLPSNVFNVFKVNSAMNTIVPKKTYAVVMPKDLEEGGFVGTCCYMQYQEVRHLER